jgi:hypothetical protein
MKSERDGCGYKFLFNHLPIREGIHFKVHFSNNYLDTRM